MDNAQDAGVGGDDGDERNNQPQGEHVEDVRPVVVHPRFPVDRAAVPS